MGEVVESVEVEAVLKSESVPKRPIKFRSSSRPGQTPELDGNLRLLVDEFPKVRTFF